MKSLLSLAFFIFSFATISCSQKINEKDIPAAVKTAFTTKFPAAKDVKWGKESAKEFEAEFKLNNTNVSANFKSDGSWVETETVIPVADLPAAVTTAIKNKYHGAVITSAEKVEMPGKTNYEVGFKVNDKKRSAELNAEGKFIE